MGVSIKKLVLEEAASAEIRKTLLAIPSPYERFEEAIIAAHRAFAGLPASLEQEIAAFARNPDSPGTMLVDGLPLDPELPATPEGRAVVDRSSFVGEGCLLGLSRMLGEPIGFLSEKSGDLIHNVTPVAAGAYTQSNQGSKVFLNYHNDSVYDADGHYHRYNPDFLILLCMRADRDGRALTYYADARDASRVLEAGDRELLRQPLYRMAAPSTYTREQAGGQRVWSQPYPVLAGPEDTPEISVAANGIMAITPEAQAALDRLTTAFNDSRVHGVVALKPGNALLINNRKGLHARSVFEPTFDGRDRWLLRTYIRRNLWDMRHRTTDRSRVFA
jgi:L-asparagine oxygenase